MTCVKQLVVLSTQYEALAKEVIVVVIVLLKCLLLHIINVQNLKHMFTLSSSFIQQTFLDH